MHAIRHQRNASKHAPLVIHYVPEYKVYVVQVEHPNQPYSLPLADFLISALYVSFSIPFHLPKFQFCFCCGGRYSAGISGCVADLSTVLVWWTKTGCG